MGKRIPGSAWKLACSLTIGGLILSAFFGTPGLRADTIVLLEGQTITGRILVEKDAQLYVDIGVTVLAIPKTEILKYDYADSLEIDSRDANDANQPDTRLGGPQDVPPQGVPYGTFGRTVRDDPGGYRTADLRKTTIAKCAEVVSEAVVKVSSPAGTGSAFFINEQGYLITNYHVIERETKIEVTMFAKVKNGFEKKRFRKVRIEAINPFVDLALLKVEDLGGAETKFVYLGDIDRLEVGEQVFAIGNPLGLERTVTDGVISTKNRAFEGLLYVQTNADINPGNSGGPLFNLAGEVIGVTNMGYVFYGGLGFAIPINYVRHFIENRDAFTYEKDNPNTGYRYIQPDRRRNQADPDATLRSSEAPRSTSFLKGKSNSRK
ncbi:MAG TPA: trypsin-like peptidase domain-containing protein [Sedimentisphaerales bacterium]|nr:trypsin-like peptidase domain-containing protein [Sedimentisphaerales bacterium]